MSSGGPANPAPGAPLGAWDGESKIVIGIDIGTTQSGVAFTFLETNQPKPKAVQRIVQWPGQEAQGQSKIPTLVWYDNDGKAVAFGAEALLRDIEGQAEENGWFLAKHFKLHLHPDEMKAKHDLKLDELPHGVPLHQIYSDFLRYLLTHTQTFFEDRIVRGRHIWESYNSNMEIVMAHPNGWGIRQQDFLRGVIVESGFVSSDTVASQVRFVTEAEASVHFCIDKTNIGSRLQLGTNFAVCDAGGSTVDTTLYSVIATVPVLRLEEKCASACVQAGGIFVNHEAAKYLYKALRHGGLPKDEAIEYTTAGVKDFEDYTKRNFHNENTAQKIVISHSRYNNSAIGIRRGQMTVTGATVKGFFDLCFEQIALSVDQQLTNFNVPHILLVGGFGDSPHLQNEFKRRYGPQGTEVTRTNEPTAKAVADGAVLWSISGSVSSRAPRYSFGVIGSRPYFPSIDNRDIEGRRTYSGIGGMKLIPGAWSQIVQKGIALDSQAICRESFTFDSGIETPGSTYFRLNLYAYLGDDEPAWAQDREGNLLPDFRRICTIEGVPESIQNAIKRRVGSSGSDFWSLDVDVCIHFGGTELEAYIEWKDNGIVQRGPAVIVPDDPIQL